jgi:hypothetical protein
MSDHNLSLLNSTVLLLFVLIVLAGAGAVPFQARASETSPSKFGDEWPPLKDCLEFSEATGEWSSGAITYRFNPDGTFLIGYVSPYRNQFQRPQQRKVTFHGTWKLSRRTFTATEKARLKIPPTNRFRGYFLELSFSENKVDPPFEEGADFSVLFSSREGGPLNHRAVFLLDEQQEYPVRRRGSSTVKTKSNPRHMHWIVIADDLEFFPKGTEPGKAAWTLEHK